MEETLIINADRCIACRICELICSMTKCGEYNPTRSYIRVLSNKDMDVAIPFLRIGCDFCGRCVEFCPSEAIKIVPLSEAAVIRKGSRLGTFPIPLIGKLVT